MKIKKKLALLAATAVMVWLPLQAAAAYEVSAYIPAAIRLEGFDRGEFAVELTALEDAPVPKEYILRRSGAGELLFGPIRYTAPGVYRYHVEQNPGNEAGVNYDASQYEATVYVENDGKGGLVTQVSAVRLNPSAGGKAEKADIVFINRKKSSGSGGSSSGSDESSESQPVVAATASAAALNAPKTGDASQLAAWACLLGGALACILFVRRRQHK